MSTLFYRCLATGLFAFSLPAFTQAQGVPELPDGHGKELVQAACVACHLTDLISNSTGYTNEQWRNVMSKMIDLPEPLAGEIAHYLSNNFQHIFYHRKFLLYFLDHLEPYLLPYF